MLYTPVESVKSVIDFVVLHDLGGSSKKKCICTIHPHQHLAFNDDIELKKIDNMLTKIKVTQVDKNRSFLPFI